MLDFLFKKRKRRKLVYSPLFCYEIMMKQGAIEAIMLTKGWKTDKQMADALGFTRAYIGRLRLRQQAVSHTVIIRLALAIGNIHDKWWIFYEIVPNRKIEPDAFQKLNMQKYKKEIPYNRFSTSAEFRRLDGEIEQIQDWRQYQLFG